MSYETQYKDIANQFRNNWAGTAFTQVQWGDANFTKPIPDYDNPLSTSWVRLTVLGFGVSNDGYLGTSEPIRSHGNIIVDCFTPVGCADIYERQLADSVVLVFDRKIFGTINCNTTSIRKGNSDEAWKHLIVDTPFHSDV